MTRSLAGLGLIVLGLPLAAWGLFVATYTGDAGGSGDTYVTIAGRDMDATPVGLFALCVALAVIATGAILALRK